MDLSHGWPLVGSLWRDSAVFRQQAVVGARPLQTVYE